MPLGSTFEIGTQIILLKIDGFLKGWILNITPLKVPSLKEVNFGKVKLWAVEHFWTDFDLRKRRDNKMDQISD